MKKTPPDGALPWTRSCFVCGQDNPRGFRLRSRVEKGRVVLRYTTQPSDTGYRDLVHGGICMTLLDEVMTWAAILATGRVCVAAEMTTRLRKPVGAGEALRVEGWVARPDRRLLLTGGRILNAAGEAVLEAEGKYVPLPKEKASFCADDFVQAPGVLDWQKAAGDAVPP